VPEYCSRSSESNNCVQVRLTASRQHNWIKSTLTKSEQVLRMIFCDPDGTMVAIAIAYCVCSTEVVIRGR
jgi:hypothetical protein